MPWNEFTVDYSYYLSGTFMNLASTVQYVFLKLLLMDLQLLHSRLSVKDYVCFENVTLTVPDSFSVCLPNQDASSQEPNPRHQHRKEV